MNVCWRKKFPSISDAENFPDHAHFHKSTCKRRHSRYYSQIILLYRCFKLLATQAFRSSFLNMVQYGFYSIYGTTQYCTQKIIFCFSYFVASLYVNTCINLPFPTFPLVFVKLFFHFFLFHSSFVTRAHLTKRQFC